jgi:hypothetical protein
MFSKKINADVRNVCKISIYKNSIEESDEENILKELQREASIGTDSLKVHSINKTSRLN